MFANPEDIASGGTVAYADSDVERVRRAHQNDLENIPLFLLATHFYLTTNPSTAVATNLIRAFTCLRFAHTFVYLNQVRCSMGRNISKTYEYPFSQQVPQPARALTFLGGLGIVFYMCGTTAMNYL